MYVAAFQPEYEYITNTRLIANAPLKISEESPAVGRNEIGWGVAMANPAIRKARIMATFSQGPGHLKSAAVLEPEYPDECDNPNEAEAQRQRRGARKDRLAVLAERHRGQ